MPQAIKGVMLGQLLVQVRSVLQGLDCIVLASVHQGPKAYALSGCGL